MQQFPTIDRSLIKEINRLGYTQGEIYEMLEVLEENANNAGYGPGDPRQSRSIRRALEALLQRFRDVLSNGQYNALLNAGYVESEIRNVLFTNLLSTTQLLERTESAWYSGEYERLRRLGSTDVEIRSLLRAGFSVSKLSALVERVKGAQRNGVDPQGLTIEQINDLLFKKRSMNGVRTLGVVPALLSGIHSKAREGQVACCIIDFVTLFDIPYGPGGALAQIDVGTRHTIIEVKVDSVTSDQQKQISKFLSSDKVNPPDASGLRKLVILYAPGYNNDATISIQALGAYVVRSCGELRRQIRQRGGP